MIWACAWPPTEKAPLESVLYCWTSVSVTLELAHGPAWELYTPRRECDGPNSALSGFAESFDSFAENFVNFAEKSGILTGTVVY